MKPHPIALVLGLAAVGLAACEQTPRTGGNAKICADFKTAKAAPAPVGADGSFSVAPPEPGRYTLGQVEVELRANGSVVITGTERLAGSALRMDRAIGNSVRLAGVSLHQALTMATVNAARAGRVAGRLRGLTTGEKADLVRFQWDPASSILQVKETIVAGVSAYRA